MFRFPTWLLTVLFTLTLAFAISLAYFETLYSLGIFLVGFFILLSALIAAVYLLAKKNTQKAIKLFLFTATLLQLSFIVAHKIDSYQPAFTIAVPDQVEGCVYLFMSTEQAADVKVDANGIGYMTTKSNIDWKVKRPSRSIDEAFNTIQGSEIQFLSENGLCLSVYNVNCLQLTQADRYPQQPADYPIFPCMDSVEFTALLKSGAVDENRLWKRVWRKSSHEDDWEFDKMASRLPAD